MSGLDLEQVLAPGGPLTGRLAVLERREGQIRMAQAVEQVLLSGGRLMAEAGPGTGKTFAYLVPALWHAQVPERRVVVSTWTRHLQEQIIHKDVPLLQAALGSTTSVALVQGRENHVCLRRAEEASERARSFAPASDRARQLGRVLQWAQGSSTGLRSELEPPPPAEVWSAVRAERGNCLGQRSPWFARCGWQWSKRNAREAAVLVVNHALLMADLKLRREGSALLPGYTHLVVDEAHHLEGVAADHLGVQVRRRSLFGLLGALEQQVPQGSLATLVRGAREAATSLFDHLVEWLDGRMTGRLRGGEPLSGDLERALETLVAALLEQADDREDEAARLEWEARAEEVAHVRHGVLEALHGTDPDMVRWVERSGSPEDVHLRTAPVDPAPILHDELFAPLQGVVLTSATLCAPDASRDGDGFEYVRRSTGLGPASRGQSLSSPFDYPRQARILVDPLPDPRSGQAWEEALVERVPFHVARTRGRAFVLFTSRRTMLRVAEAAEDALHRAGVEVLVQGIRQSRTRLLEEFRRLQPAALFGLASFWEGVDVPGEDLSQVILTRLPFAVPDHPRDQAQSDLLRRQGRNPFLDLSLPQAVLRFRQGFGRLIRTREDEGLVTVLDPRVLSKPYGKAFLQALPDCPRAVMRGDEEEPLPESFHARAVGGDP